MLENSLKRKEPNFEQRNKGIGCSIYYPGPIPKLQILTKKNIKQKVNEFKKCSSF